MSTFHAVLRSYNMVTARSFDVKLMPET